HAAQGDLRQSPAPAVAEPVRQGAAPAHGPQGGGGDPVDRDPTRSGGHLRLPGRARSGRPAPAGRGGRDPGRPGGHRPRRLLRRRGGRRRRGRLAAGRQGRSAPGAARGPALRPAQRPVGGSRSVSISEPFIRRPVATSLLTAGLLLAGLIGYKQLPVAGLPQGGYPTILVSTLLPGAGAATMALAGATPLGGRVGA